MKDKLIIILEDILETDIKDDDSDKNIDSWDSLNHLRIILEIESEFSIKVDHNNIQKLNSVKSILHYINSKQ